MEIETKGFRIDLSRAQWFTSTRGAPDGDNCVEVAFVDEAIAVRDSKNPQGPALIFTAAAVNGLSFNLGQRMNSLPAQIYGDVAQANNQLVDRAWGSALTLVVLILLITLIARFVARRSRLA